MPLAHCWGPPVAIIENPNILPQGYLWLKGRGKGVPVTFRKDTEAKQKYGCTHA